MLAIFMPPFRSAELKNIIDSFQRLLAANVDAAQHLATRRAKADSEQATWLDRMIEDNQRAERALKRIVSCYEQCARLPAAWPAATSPDAQLSRTDAHPPLH